MQTRFALGFSLLTLACCQVPNPHDAEQQSALSSGGGGGGHGNADANGPILFDLGAPNVDLSVPAQRTFLELVSTDAAVLKNFSFAKVVKQILATSVASGETLASTETDVAVFERWMKTYAKATSATLGCNSSGIDPNGYGLECPRVESELASSAVFDAFEPVGVFNRFDLAAANGSNCGEYRIVFALTNPPASLPPTRAFIIFEASLPNPTPASGVAGCLPVAQFWKNLGSASEAERVSQLDAFYFTGVTSDGKKIGPVVAAKNYGLLEANGSDAVTGRFGQVRANFFANFVQWNLREFKLHTTCPTAKTCELGFDHVTNAANPAVQLFAGTKSLASQFSPAFVKQVDALAASTINGIGMSFAGEFNDYESISSPPFGSGPAINVDYSASADATITKAIQTELTRIKSKLTPKNILDRATTQTCAGCHEVSNGVNLGPAIDPLVWPQSGTFVQIDEQSQLSPALTTQFLPHRQQVLDTFIAAHTKAPEEQALGENVDSTLTIDGKALNAPN